MSTSLLRTNATFTSTWALVVLTVYFVLSGFAGIVYQIGWARQRGSKVRWPRSAVRR